MEIQLIVFTKSLNILRKNHLLVGENGNLEGKLAVDKELASTEKEWRGFLPHLLFLFFAKLRRKKLKGDGN